MSDAYHRAALERYRETRAAILGCSVPDFDAHSLVVVERPPTQQERFLMMALTMGTGTVASVHPDYKQWVTENAPADKHYRAMFPNALLQPLVEEARRRGQPAGWRSPNLSFLPAREPVALPVPDGLSVAVFDLAWRNHMWPLGEFHNALGEVNEPDDIAGFQYALAIMDGDTPAAVAGAWDDQPGLVEIGVDVARAYRGRGLGEVVVTNIARHIADQGNIPTYYCAPTNVRSHRNAIGSGFTPTASACRATFDRPAAP
jgi:RimJ/RimL family protein N-acetyltransferase